MAWTREEKEKKTRRTAREIAALLRSEDRSVARPEEEQFEEEQFNFGRVVAMLGITPRTLRLYEKWGLIDPPQRTEGGSRVYAKEEVDRLEFILKLKVLGLSLRDIRELVQPHGAKNDPAAAMPRVIELLDLHLREVKSQIASLAALKGELASCRRRVEGVFHGSGTGLERAG